MRSSGPKVFPYQPCCQIFTQAIKFFLSRTKWLPSIPYNLIPVQPHRRTRVITLSRTPPSSSSLKVINNSFRHASPCLWNQLPKELRLPADHEDFPLLSQLSDLTHVTSSFASSPTITPSLFHSRLKTRVFHKSFPALFFYTHRTDSIDSSCFFLFFFLGHASFNFGIVCLAKLA